MKTSLNKHKRSAAGLLIAVAAFAAALTGCQKDFEMDLPLAVAARELSLSKEAGSTHVLVYSNGEWTARFTRNVKWASLNKLEGYGNHEIVFPPPRAFADAYEVKHFRKPQISRVGNAAALCGFYVQAEASGVGKGNLRFAFNNRHALPTAIIGVYKAVCQRLAKRKAHKRTAVRKAFVGLKIIELV